MFNIGSWELIIIVIAALLLLGPKKLPDFARWVGTALREVRNVTQEVRNAIDLEVEKAELEELKRQFEDDLNVDNLLNPPAPDPLASQDSPLEVVAPSTIEPVYNDEEPASGIPAQTADATEPVTSDSAADPTLASAQGDVSPQEDLSLDSTAPTSPTTSEPAKIG
jgi:sec-independent protein translocase protein TatB